MRKARKDRINIAAGGGFEDLDLLPNGRGRSPNVRDKRFSEGIVGIDQHANAHGSRLQLMQQPKLLCPKLSNDKRDTGDIAARPVETPPIETAPRVEPHLVAIAADDQPAAVVLDLVDPTPALSALVWMALEGRAGLSLDLRLVVQNDIQQ